MHGANVDSATMPASSTEPIHPFLLLLLVLWDIVHPHASSVTYWDSGIPLRTVKERGGIHYGQLMQLAMQRPIYINYTQSTELQESKFGTYISIIQ